MTTGSLSIKLKSTNSELSNNFPITKAGEATHLCRYDDRVVATIGRRRKRDFAFPFAACFNELPGNVSRDVEGLGNRSPLRNQARQFVGGRQVNSLRQLLYLDANGEFHFQDNCTNAGRMASDRMTRYCRRPFYKIIVPIPIDRASTVNYEPRQRALEAGQDAATAYDESMAICANWWRRNIAGS
jgi:hypothetical protein